MGTGIRLRGLTLSAPALGRLKRFDPLETNGSLLLIDPTHPSQQWAAGVPAAGAVVPNVLSDFAAALGLSGTAAGATIAVDGTLSGNVQVERSGKGGAHGIVAQPSTDFPTAFWGMRLPDWLCTYLLANPTHSYFTAVWGRNTRARIVGNDVQSYTTMITSTSSFGNNGLTLISERQTRPDGVNWIAQGLGLRRLNPGGLGPSHMNVGAAGFTGSVPASIAAMYRWAHGFGRPIGNASAVGDKLASRVFYRFYMEDLTVSGRNYAQVDALAQAEFAAQITTEGGRYFGDTFTDPGTVFPPG